MSKVMVGRQPVFDRDYRVQAYELLFRPLGGEDGAEELLPDTAEVIGRALNDLGIDAVTGALPAWVNVDERMLVEEQEVLELLPPERTGIEVLEQVPDSDRVRDALARLKARGYTVLLDDVTDAERVLPLLEHADIVKFDLHGVENLAEQVRRLRPHRVRLLAEKVETHEDFERARALNFDYYQGHFFCRPEIVEGRKVPESRLSVMRAMAEVLSAEAIEEVHEVIRQDVGLSYRLLKYINSAAFGLRHPVASIEQAMSLLGLSNLRRWLALLAMTRLGEHKPDELIRLALLRAHFLEQLALARGDAEPGDDFLLGLFSVLDALLDLPMPKAIADLSLPDAVRQALAQRQGPLADRLALVHALEDADWEKVAEWQQRNRGVSIGQIAALQIDAMRWADAQMLELNAA